MATQIPRFPPLGGLVLISPQASSSPVAIPGKGDTSPSPSDSNASASSSSFLQTPRTAFGSPKNIQAQSPLLRTPGEIVHKILCSSGVTDPIGLSRAAKTCQELRSLIYDNPDQALWRDIHMDLYDDPRSSGWYPDQRDAIDWRAQVQQRGHISRVARDWGEERYPELADLVDTICSTLLDLYLDLPAIPPPAPSGSASTPAPDSYPPDNDLTPDLSPDIESLNVPVIEAILRSPLFAYLYMNHSYRASRPVLRPLPGQMASPLRRTMRQDIHPMLSMLHCLLPPDFDTDDETHRAHRGHLRETVYLAQHYTAKNDYGPFTPDGKVDWSLMDAITSVMMANAKDVVALGEDSWRLALKPLSYGIETVRSWGWKDMQRPADLGEDEIWDWAGVEGTWCGSYAFLDYADWITLNEPRIVAIRRQVGQLDLSSYSEAVGDLLHMHLTIDRPSKASLATCGRTTASSTGRESETLPAITTSIPEGDLLPPIFFSGHSAQSGATWPTSTAASYVRGVVRLTTDWPPQVRWTMVIRYGGEDRWRVEGAQMGGRGSKRGFFGIWTDAAKEEHSPNGPTWYWKK